MGGLCSPWGAGRNATPPESLRRRAGVKGRCGGHSSTRFAVPTKKKIKAFLSLRASDPRLASQLREPSLHICIHAYS